VKSLDQWLSEYQESHQNPVNKRIHMIAVPAIVMSIAAMLWTIPSFEIPQPFARLSNPAVIVMILLTSYYVFLSPLLAAVNTVFSIIMILLLIAAETWDLPIFYIGLTTFILAWILQFYGHKIEGKKPSFAQDIQFLLIGPAWVLMDIIGHNPNKPKP